ncbi:MAG: hypothetical protein WCT31_05030 [Candidatus Micrarchaeia archaeon]|jgi:hypothetical protein
MCQGAALASHNRKPTIMDVRRAMNLFYKNPYDGYDPHMENTGHYPLMKQGLSVLAQEGHVSGKKIVDLGGGSCELLAHILMCKLNQILSTSNGSAPFRLVNVDATESILVGGAARLLRRLGRIKTAGSEHGDNLEIRAHVAGGNWTTLNLNQLRMDRQKQFYDEISLTRPSDAEKELLRINLILEDVLALPDHAKLDLMGANTVLVSYCFHWFIDKPAVATLIRELLAEDGKFVSIEEWPLRVTTPDLSGFEPKERRNRERFYKTLTDAIEAATTPIEVPGKLYELFTAAGLEQIPLTATQREFVNKIDMQHNMFSGVFKRTH